MTFTEARLERAVIELLGEQGYPHLSGAAIEREPQDVLIRQDLRHYLAGRYRPDGITPAEIESVIRALEVLPASDLYDTNRAVMKRVSDGFSLKREDRARKDLHLTLIDPDEPDNNLFKLVDQLEIVGTETRIPDAILYVNGLPLVVFEFKSAIRPEAPPLLHTAFAQVTA